MQSAGFAAQQSRQALDAAQRNANELAQMRQLLQESNANAEQLKKALASVQVARGGNPNIQRIENIPGRRIPFDYVVDIPIGADLTAVTQGSITISQDGPFVAVARYATFNSQYTFQRIDPVTQAQATFAGRSFGRYRPIHSAWDLNDGRPVSQMFLQPQPFPGNGAPHMISPSNESSFRSMEADYRIQFLEAGSGWPRSNQEVPSSFYTRSINEPFELGALDFFERGEVLTWKVLPLHSNNAPLGNVAGFGASNPSYPFQDSQWDAVEGISDPELDTAGTKDPITRAPNGILTIGFHGFRIVQQPGNGYE